MGSLAVRGTPFDAEGDAAAGASACRPFVLTTESEFDGLEAEWEELLEDSPQWSFFLRWHWTRLWWETFAPALGGLHLVGCRTASGQLVGLAPLYWQRRRTGVVSSLRELAFLGTGNGIRITEYADIITRHGYETAASAAIARCIMNERAWDRLCLWGIPGTSPTLHHFARHLGTRASVRYTERAPYVDTSRDWESFRQSIGKSSRENISRHARRLFANHAGVFRRVDQREEVRPTMDALVRLHQSRWNASGERGAFASPAFERFLRTAVEQSHARGQLRLWSLSVAGEVAAVQVAFFDRGRAHAFQVGIDPEHAKLRLGNVLFWLCIKDSIESPGIDQFDFMTGGSGYKELLAKHGVDLAEVELVRAGLPSALYLAETGLVRALQAIWRTVVPEPLRTARSRWLRRRRFRAGRRPDAARPD